MSVYWWSDDSNSFLPLHPHTSSPLARGSAAVQLWVSLVLSVQDAISHDMAFCTCVVGFYVSLNKWQITRKSDGEEKEC